MIAILFGPPMAILTEATRPETSGAIRKIPESSCDCQVGLWIEIDASANGSG
jgi:hypothetical protein